MTVNYAQRAKCAYAAAEAANDPRDKAAYRSAARLWEQLAQPRSESTYSMAPYRLQLAMLKRRAAEPLEASTSAIGESHQTVTQSSNVASARQEARESVTIEF